MMETKRLRNKWAYGLHRGWASGVVIILGGVLLATVIAGAFKPGLKTAKASETRITSKQIKNGNSWLVLTNVGFEATDVEFGGEIYRLVCSTCHGDQGQGLTKEWLATINPEDRNCWQSKCHVENHPPDGFVLPRYVPAITGAHMAARFPNALDLYRFISTLMPYHAPGSLQADEYWQVTAYVLYLNGINTTSVKLDEIVARGIQLR